MSRRRKKPQRDSPVYWLDRCLGTRVVPEALRAAGVDVRLYTDLYPTQEDVPDIVWIPEVTGRGWVILTQDAAISRRSDELRALRTAKARYVCLAAQNLTGAQQAECFLKRRRTIEGLLAHHHAPVIVKVLRSSVQRHDGKAWRPVKLKG